MRAAHRRRYDLQIIYIVVHRKRRDTDPNAEVRSSSNVCRGICSKRVRPRPLQYFGQDLEPQDREESRVYGHVRRATLISIDRPQANSSRSCEMVSATCTNDSPRETRSTTRRKVAREGSKTTHCSTGYSLSSPSSVESYAAETPWRTRPEVIFAAGSSSFENSLAEMSPTAF
jgi:hypothetical protein